MQQSIRFLSNFTSKNKQLANIARQSKELACFTSKNNKRYNEIINKLQLYIPREQLVCGFNRCCVNCRHFKIQNNKAVCGLFSMVDLKNNTIKYMSIEVCRKSKFMCTQRGIFFDKVRKNY